VDAASRSLGSRWPALALTSRASASTAPASNGPASKTPNTNAPSSAPTWSPVSVRQPPSARDPGPKPRGGHRPDRWPAPDRQPGPSRGRGRGREPRAPPGWGRAPSGSRGPARPARPPRAARDTGPFDGPQHQPARDPVQRRVDRAQVRGTVGCGGPRGGGGADTRRPRRPGGIATWRPHGGDATNGPRSRRGGGQDRVQVGLGDLVPEPGDQRAFRRPERDPGQRAQAADRGLDLGIHRRHDLRAVAQVELVAVVRGRVVAGRDHHPGPAARCRTANASSGVGLRPGSRCTRMPAPVSTAAASRANPAERCRASQPSTTPARAASGRARAASGPGPPSRPGPRRGSSGWARPPSRRAGQRAELEPPGEPVGQAGRGRPAGRVVPAGRVEQILQFGPVPGAGIVRDPGPGPLHEVFGDRVAGDHAVRAAPGPAGCPSGPAAACPAATTSA